MRIICIHCDFEMKPGEILAGEVYYSKEQSELKVAVKCIEPITFDEYYAFVKQHNLPYSVTRYTAKNLYRVEVLD